MHLAVGRLTRGDERLTSIASDDILISVRQDKQPQSTMERHYAYDPELGESKQVDAVTLPDDYVV